MSKRKAISKTRNSDEDEGSSPKRGRYSASHQRQKKAHKEFFNLSRWPLLKFQSPIILEKGGSIQYNLFKPLDYIRSWDESSKVVLTNNGNTAILRFKDDNLPILQGGPLNNEYVFDNLHFHWGSTNDDGCEHVVDGQRYSMEAHIVHYNKKYGTFSKAFNKPDGLAVLAFFLEVGDTENKDFEKLSAGISNIERKNSFVRITQDSLQWIEEVFHCKGYYTYQGSLTTPPYKENVTWIVFPQPIGISTQQIEGFRNLKSSCCKTNVIENNCRPIQPPPQYKKLDILYVDSHI